MDWWSVTRVTFPTEKKIYSDFLMKVNQIQEIITMRMKRKGMMMMIKKQSWQGLPFIFIGESRISFITFSLFRTFYLIYRWRRWRWWWEGWGRLSERNEEIALWYYYRYSSEYIVDHFLWFVQPINLSSYGSETQTCQHPFPL